MANKNFKVELGVTVANTTASANLDINSFRVGSTIANTSGVYSDVVNATSLTVGSSHEANTTQYKSPAINVRNQTNTNILAVTTSANVGVNTQLSTTQMFFQNTTSAVNVSANSTVLKIGNTTTWVNVHSQGFEHRRTCNVVANSSTLTIANSTTSTSFGINGLRVNSTVFAETTTIGANVTVNTSMIHIGNSTVNTWANSTFIKTPTLNAQSFFREDYTNHAVGEVLLANGSFSSTTNLDINVSAFNTISPSISSIRIFLYNVTSTVDASSLGFTWSNTTSTSFGDGANTNYSYQRTRANTSAGTNRTNWGNWTDNNMYSGIMFDTASSALGCCVNVVVHDPFVATQTWGSCRGTHWEDGANEIAHGFAVFGSISFSIVDYFRFFADSGLISGQYKIYGWLGEPIVTA